MMSASARSALTGIAGSAAVLLLAAIALTTAEAGDRDRPSRPAPAAVRGGLVRPADHASDAASAAGEDTWLKRALRRAGLERGAARG